MGSRSLPVPWLPGGDRGQILGAASMMAQRPFCIVQNILAQRGKRDRSCPAIYKLSAQILLQPPNSSAQGRLANIQMIGCLGEAPFPGNRGRKPLIAGIPFAILRAMVCHFQITMPCNPPDCNKLTR